MKGILIKILAGIVLFLAGVAVGVPACRLYDKAHAQAEIVVSAPAGTEDSAANMNNGVSGDDLLLRVRDGNLEWYDGVRWNQAGSVNELVSADSIAHPSEEWQALAARLAEAHAAEYAEDQAALSRERGSLSVDEIVAARPQTTAPAVARPAASATAQPTAPVNSTHDNDDNANSDNDDHNDNSPAPAPEPEPAPAPEPADTGDGENIEWSGDYE